MNIFETKVLVPSAARGANGNTTAEVVGAARNVDIVLDVTAASATSTLDVVVETSHDGATWFTATGNALTQATAVGVQHKRISVNGPLVRVRWTVGGTTPSFTFSVSAYAS